MSHRIKLLMAALAAEDESARWLLLRRLIRDTRPARRAAVQRSLLWC